jgi:YidC/Oxa1 family membrane protein insertase
MFNNDDMNKRIMLFFVIVSVLLIGYTIINQTINPQPQQQNKEINQPVVSQNTTTTEQKSNQTNEKTTTPYISSGNYDLLLNNQRFNSDNLNDFVEIKTNYGIVKISRIGARVISVYLNQYNTDTIPKIAKENKIFPTEIITTNPEITALINFSEYELKQEGNKYIFTLNKNGIKITKIFELNPDETISYSLKYHGLENLGIAVVNGITPEAEASAFGHRGSLIKTDKELIKIDTDIKTTQIIRGNILFSFAIFGIVSVLYWFK